MATPAEKRNPNKYCEFHADTGHSTDECMQLRKQIDEMIKRALRTPNIHGRRSILRSSIRALLRQVERISKKRTKNEAKMTKPDTEWKSVEKTKSRHLLDSFPAKLITPPPITFHLDSCSHNNKNVTTTNPTS
ncbi:hypothetical protein Tco_0673063 [Tanacetum coccineum]